MGNPYPPAEHDFSSGPYVQGQRLFEENQSLKARIAQLTHIDSDGCRGLADIAALTRRYIPETHREAAVQLVRLAYIRGKIDGVEHTAVPMVISVCPLCRGKEG